MSWIHAFLLKTLFEYQLQKGRFNKVAARLEGFRMNRATAYRANTSLVRRQMGFRENMAMLSARRRQLKGGAFASINDLRRVGGIRHTQSQTIGGIRKRPVHAGGRLFGQQRSGFALQRPNPNARGFDLLRGQAQTSGSITAPASSSGSSDALLKQIKIVAELDQVPPPLLCQIADAERRLGRRLSDNLNSPNGRQFGGNVFSTL